MADFEYFRVCIIYNGYWDPSVVEVWGWEVVVEGREREETGAVVCVSEGEGINVMDDVINEVDKCGVRGRERALAGEKYI